MLRRSPRRLLLETLERRNLLTAMLEASAAVAPEAEGFVTGTVSGVVFADSDGNGARGAAERGLAGQSIYQDLNNNGVRDLQPSGAMEPRVLTNADGSFQFSELGIGTHVFALEHVAAPAITTPTETHFGEASEIAAGVGTAAVAVTDLDGDHVQDIVAVNGGDNSLFIDFQDGRSLLFSQLTSPLLGDEPTDLVARDFDGDNHIDIAVASLTSKKVNLFLSSAQSVGNTGCESLAGTSAADLFTVICDLTAAKFLTSIAASDLDDDGDEDLVVSADDQLDSGMLQVFENDGHGNFALSGSWTSPPHPQSILIGQFLREDNPEIAVLHRGSSSLAGTVSVVSVVGNAPTGPMQTVGTAGLGGRDMIAADLDGDGHRDFVVANRHANEITVLWWNAATQSYQTFVEPQNFSATSIAVADVDLDQDADLVLTRGVDGDEVMLIENQTPGPGHRPQFAEATTIGTTPFIREFQPSVELADLDNNSLPDVVIASGSSVESNGGIRVLMNLRSTHRVEITKPSPNQQILFGVIANPHFNGNSPADVDGNTEVTAADALAIINALPELSGTLPAENDLGRFLDVNNDRMLSAEDALIVINEIGRLEQQRNQQTFGQASGENASIPPSDFSFQRQWALNNENGVDIDALNAWDLTLGDREVVVAVIDSGIDLAHPDLYLNVWINQNEIPPTIRGQLTDIDGDGLITFYDLNNLRLTNSGYEVASTGQAATDAELAEQTPYASGANAAFVADINGNGRIDGFDLVNSVSQWVDRIDSDGNSYPDDIVGANFREDDILPEDKSGHGTHIAGIIAALRGNGRGTSGASPNVRLMPLKVLDLKNRGEQADIAEAIEYVTNMRQSGVFVPVINASFASPTFDNNVHDAIDAARLENILFVTTAGNASGDQQTDLDEVTNGHYPARYDLDNIVVVASHDRDGDFHRRSNFGVQSVDLAAPGVGIESTALSIVEALRGADTSKSRNGTSFAAPFVASAAALVWSRAPEADYRAVKTALLEGTVKVGAFTDRVATGGRLNAYNSLLPTANVDRTQNIVAETMEPHIVELEFHSIAGLDVTSLDDGDLTVVRADTGEVFTAKLMDFTPAGNAVIARYTVEPPGGSWDANDRAQYSVVLNANQVADSSGVTHRESQVLGSFSVEILEGLVFRVNSHRDAPDLILDGVSDDGAGNSTLRAAVMEANAATRSATIVLDSGVYSLHVKAPDTGAAQAGDLEVIGDITIIGQGRDRTIIDASGLRDRVLNVFPGARLKLIDLRVTSGDVRELGTSDAERKGGAVWSRGMLETLRVDFIGNHAHRGGAVYSQDQGTYLATDTIFADNQAQRDGGAIVSEDVLNLSASEFTNNRADSGGAIFAQLGDVIAHDSIFADNTSTFVGGAIRSNCGETAPCTIDLNNVLFNRNETGNTGGALYVNGAGGPVNIDISGSSFSGNRATDGGAILSQGVSAVKFTVDGTDFVNNRAMQEGGAINLRTASATTSTFDLTNGHVNQNTAGTQGGAIYTFDPINISDTEINENVAGGKGGAIYNSTHLVLNNVHLDSNRATGDDGGAIHSTGNPETSLKMTDSRVTRNSAFDHGGGISALSPVELRRVLIDGNMSFDDGGGLRFQSDSIVVDSTITNNTGSEGGGLFAFGATHLVENTLIAFNLATNATSEGGGGIFNGGELALRNVTISGNEAENIGGAIFNKAAANISLLHVTIVDNVADRWGAIYNKDGSVRLENSILASNVGVVDLSMPHLALDLTHNNLIDNVSFLGPVTLGTDNLVGDTNSPLDPRLAPLADNGGLTRTHALLPGSPAIDGATHSSPLITDQRGLVRPIDGDRDGTIRADIGAFELQ